MVYREGEKNAMENSICRRNSEYMITYSLKKGEFLKSQHYKSSAIN